MCSLILLSFALTLPDGFDFILRMKPLAQSLCGLTAGGVGYLAGYWFGAVAFGVSPEKAVFLTAALWAIFLPALIWIHSSVYKLMEVNASG